MTRMSSLLLLDRSLDTWLDGVCKSVCDEHDWAMPEFNATARSVFAGAGRSTTDKAPVAEEEQCQAADGADKDWEGEGSDGAVTTAPAAAVAAEA